MNSKKEIKGLIDTFYEIISGKAEEKRDWDRFRSLFFSRAQLIHNKISDERKCQTIPCDVESYISRLSEVLAKKDFYEYGYDYEIEICGNIAQAKSKYEAKAAQNHTTPIKSGTNLVQLINDGSKWKIMNMLWEDK